MPDDTVPLPGSGPFLIAHGEVRCRGVSREGRGFDAYVCGDDEAMAVAHDSDGTLVAWGVAGDVDAKATALGEALSDVMGARAPSILVVRFMPTRESLAELNACIAVSGRVLRFGAALAAMDGVDESPPPSMWH